MSKIAVAGVFLVGLWSGCIAAQSDHRVFRISAADDARPNEVSIAINPRNPNNLVVVGMMRGYQSDVFGNYSFSTQDGGATWEISESPNPGERTQGDDAVIFDETGQAIRSFISFKNLWVEDPQSAANGIMICRSSDGGNSWNDAVAVVDHLNTITPFEDKPWPAIDRNPNSPFHQSLYLAWTRFDKYGSAAEQDRSHIYCGRSPDGGETFFSPVRVSDQPGDCLDDDNTVEGCVPAVGPDGELYLAWAGPRGLEFDRSLDGGKSFGRDVLISDMPGGWSSNVDGLSRHNGMPVTGVDLSDGPNRGSIYAMWIDERNQGKDVFLSSSRDRGETWSKPQRVNAEMPDKNLEQFFAWMSVDPADGSLNLVYYQREGKSDALATCQLARSIDGGSSFQIYDIGIPSFRTSDQEFFGDYVGIDAFGGRVVAALPHFDESGRLVLSVARFDFNPGTQKTIQ